jgi:hypothetical protein
LIARRSFEIGSASERCLGVPEWSTEDGASPHPEEVRLLLEGDGMGIPTVEEEGVRASLGVEGTMRVDVEHTLIVEVGESEHTVIRFRADLETQTSSQL